MTEEHPEYKSPIKTVSGGEGDRCKYPTRCDMYGCGCQHNCSYCYARGLLEFRGLWHPEAPSVADRRKVARALDKVPEGTTLRLGGMTDPFQPLEREVGSTKWLIEELNSRGIGYLVVTKSDYVADYAGDVLDEALAHVQVSVTSTDDSKTLEPYAPPPSRRLECADALHDMGIDTQVRLSPLIPGYVDPDVINSASTDKVVVEFLRTNSRMERGMPWLDPSPYVIKAGGYRSMTLQDKLKALEPYAGKRVTVCEDVPEHYEYFREHVNPNKDDCCDLKTVGAKKGAEP